MAIGRARGDERAANAAHQAIASPLLETPLAGARTILVNIASADCTLVEIQEIITAIQGTAAPDADIVLGMVIDESMVEELQIVLIATSCACVTNRPSSGRRAGLVDISRSASAVSVEREVAMLGKPREGESHIETTVKVEGPRNRLWRRSAESVPLLR
jgi:cell division GTPase FtsZ